MSWYFRPADGSFNHQCDLDKTSCAVSYLIYRIYKRGQKPDMEAHPLPLPGKYLMVYDERPLNQS